MSPPACVNHYTLQHTACWKCCVLSGKICSQEITLSRKLSAATSLLRKNLRSFWRIGLEHRCSLDTGFLKACYESGKECAQKISLDCVPMIWKSSKNFLWGVGGRHGKNYLFGSTPHYKNALPLENVHNVKATSTTLHYLSNQEWSFHHL